MFLLFRVGNLTYYSAPLEGAKNPGIGTGTCDHMVLEISENYVTLREVSLRCKDTSRRITRTEY